MNINIKTLAHKNYWRRTQFLLGGIYALILFSAVVFLLTQFISQ